MKFKPSILMLTVALFAALVLPVRVLAQHARYRVIDIGTLGGPSTAQQGNGLGTAQFINSRGTVVGTSDTLVPDPNAPNNCQNPECLVSHAFQWQDGILTDLGSPSGRKHESRQRDQCAWLDCRRLGHWCDCSC
jgi:hypothetical protein